MSKYCEIREYKIDNMSARCASELTVVELKERLRELRLPCTGRKNELVLRLNESVRSGIWIEKQPEMAIGSAEGAVGIRASEESIYGIKTQSEHHSRDTSALKAQLEILRREVGRAQSAQRGFAAQCVRM